MKLETQLSAHPISGTTAVKFRLVLETYERSLIDQLSLWDAEFVVEKRVLNNTADSISLRQAVTNPLFFEHGIPFTNQRDIELFLASLEASVVGWNRRFREHNQKKYDAEADPNTSEAGFVVCEKCGENMPATYCTCPYCGRTDLRGMPIPFSLMLVSVGLLYIFRGNLAAVICISPSVLLFSAICGNFLIQILRGKFFPKK